MLKRAIALLYVVPGLALASSGAWHASGSGPGLQNRGMQVPSQAVRPAEPVSGTVTQVAWRYVLNGPAPAGLVVHLCAEKRCALLDGASGTTRALTHISAGEPLHFVYGIPGTGRLPHALRVIGNEVMVNYRQR